MESNFYESPLQGYKDLRKETFINNNFSAPGSKILWEISSGRKGREYRGSREEKADISEGRYGDGDTQGNVTIVSYNPVNFCPNKLILKPDSLLKFRGTEMVTLKCSNGDQETDETETGNN